MKLRNMLKFRMGWVGSTGPESEVVLSSRVRLARNLKDHPFTSQAASKALAKVLEEAFAACRKTKTLAKAAYLELEELEQVDHVFLAERHLISHALADSPASRGVAVGERENLSVMVNEEDHLRLQALKAGLGLHQAFKEVEALDDDLSRELDQAFHPEWGYLTACPTNTGTGLRASCLMHLAGLTLTRQLPPLLESMSKMGVIARGLYGEGTRIMGDLYQISNARALGHSEEEFLDKIEAVVKNLVAREKESLKAASSGIHRGRVEDLVYRSIGILSHARSISYEEAMQHLSYVRTGHALGWEMPVSLDAVNELIIFIQPAHIQMIADKELGPAERDVLRAALLRKRFGGKT